MRRLLARLLRRWADRLEPPVPPTSLINLLIDAHERYGTAHAITPALMEVSALWAAGDDGKLWYSRDGQPAVQVEWPGEEAQ